MKFILKVSDYTKEFYISLDKLTSRLIRRKNSKRVNEISQSSVYDVCSGFTNHSNEFIEILNKLENN